MLRTHNRKKIYLSGLWLVVAFAALLITPVASAATKSGKTTGSSNTSTSQSSAQPTNISNGVTQSYNAATSVEIGMLVELKPKDPTTVIPLSDLPTHGFISVVPRNQLPVAFVWDGTICPPQ